jgi:hypothetical protein
MAAAAESIQGMHLPRARTRRHALEVVQPTARRERRQRPDESALLHPEAGAALALAASPLEDGARPVAVVLADGTVRSLHAGAPDERRFSSGRLSGSGWTLWWQRRAFTPSA